MRLRARAEFANWVVAFFAPEANRRVELTVRVVVFPVTGSGAELPARRTDYRFTLEAGDPGGVEACVTGEEIEGHSLGPAGFPAFLRVINSGKGLRPFSDFGRFRDYIPGLRQRFVEGRVGIVEKEGPLHLSLRVWEPAHGGEAMLDVVGADADDRD